MSINSPFTTKKERGAYSAIVYKEGNLFIAEDEEGNTIIENTDAATVIQKAIDDYAPEGLVLVKPDITLTSTLKVLNTYSKIKFSGSITSAGVDAIQIGDSTHYAHTCDIEIYKINGSDKTANGIVFSNTSASIISFVKIDFVDVGLYFNPAAGARATENYIRGGMMYGMGSAGIRFANSSDVMQGNRIEASIFDAPIGFDLISGGDSEFQTYLGCIDCATVGDSEDIKDEVGQQLFICNFVRRNTCTIAANSLLLNASGALEIMLEARGGIVDMLNIGFEPMLMWDFNRNSTGDWTKTNCTMGTPSKSVTRLTATSAAPNIYRYVELDGGQAQIIVIRYKYISGTTTGGIIYYATSGHGFSASYLKTFSTITDGEWHVCVVDMSDLNQGGTDWIDNTITEIRYDYANGNAVLDIDYIAIGTRGYASIYHMDDALKTPASASAQGNKGDMRWDAGYIYICTATDTWKRVAIATW